MDSTNTVMVKFITYLNEYVATLDKRLQDMETLYNAHSYLLSNYKQNVDLVEAVSSIPLEKICELLSLFESTSKYSQTELENALKFCKICELNPKFKGHERYQEMHSILEYVNNVFTRHIFSNQSEINYNRIEDTKSLAKKFHDLQSFINGTLPNYVLEPVESYYFEHANLSPEEWLEVYFNLTMIQIEYYKRSEDELKAEIATKEEQRRIAMTEALEKKILKSLPAEDALVLKPNGQTAEVEEPEVEEDIPEPVVKTSEPKGKPLSSNEEISQKLAILQEKYKAYKYLGKITPTMRESFKLNFDLNDIPSSLEYVKIAYNPTDYHKFLFFCFYEKYSTILNDVSEPYNEDFDEYVEFILEDITQALDFITILEDELALADKELEQATESELPQPEEVEKPYKLIFYDVSSSSEIEKNMKSMTSEKINDLVSLLSRLEDGRFDGVRFLKKNTKVGFKLLIGQLVFVTFRTLPNNHILIFTSGSLEEMNNNSVNNRLNAYDINVEKKINSIIKDGTLEYRKLLKRSEDIHSLVFTQSLGKGV